MEQPPCLPGFEPVRPHDPDPEDTAELRLQVIRLQRRVEQLESFKIGGWFCPDCGTMCEARQQYRPGMDLGPVENLYHPPVHP